MSDSQENIEAKLSAFIEGDLDAAGRLEIERHLEANPSHRKLLEELKRTRDFVRGLPRAKAPPELVETLQGQLERSSLLDGIGEEAQSLQLHSSRWPQIVSIAAVVLLAVGLATVVYVALPSGAERPAVTQNTGEGELGKTTPLPASRPTTTVSTITVGAAGADSLAGAMTDSAVPTAAPSTPLAKAKPATPAAVEMANAVSSEPREGAGAVAGPVVNANVPTAPVAAAPVATPPPAASIAPAEQPEKPSQADIEALAFANPADADHAVARATDAFKEADAKKMAAPLTASEVPADAVHVVVNTTDFARANADVMTFFNSNQISYENVLPDAGQQLAQNNYTANYGVADANKFEGEKAKESLLGVEQKQLQQEMPPIAGGVARGMLNSDDARLKEQEQLQRPVAQQQLLARNVTRRQVFALQSAVTQGGAKDAQVIDRALAAQMSADTLRTGDVVQVTVNELVGAGVEKTNTVRVGSDGTVTMPMIEPVPAAGQTTDELSQSIARRYRDASLIAKPTVTVARADKALEEKADTATGWAHAAGEKQAAAAGVTTTQPTTGPTTTPVAAATTVSAVDAPVDVLIIVNAFAPAAAGPADATMPGTMPAAATLPVPTAPAATLPSTQPVTTAPAPVIAP